MKRAVVVVGSHHAGKSKTINKYLKKLIGISEFAHRFRIRKKDGAIFSQSLEERFGKGFVLSQSLEEKGLDDVGDFVARYERYDLLVVAARPAGESPSLYECLKSELKQAGYLVATINVVKGKPEPFYARKAKKILRYLRRRTLSKSS